VISNGFGASVGMEAAYAQLGSGFASMDGRFLNLRRSDLRILVGAGAGAGIAAAFGAPLTGAFYAFEIIIGSYTLANIAPVLAAALAGVVVTRLLNVEPLVIKTVVTDTMNLSHYLLFGGLGVVCALFGVLVMRMVGWTEQLVGLAPGPKWLRPALGGVVLAAIAWNAPQTLSAGHGALHVDLAEELAVGSLIFLISTKTLASVVSLGTGFRGGLFFASLYLGALGGPGGGDHRRTAHHVVPGPGDYRRFRPDGGDPHRLDHRQRHCPRDLRLFLLHLATASARRNHPQRS
jgi:CIC family chloride channel protein